MPGAGAPAQGSRQVEPPAPRKIASDTSRRDARVKGEPLRFIRGHHRRIAPAPPLGYTVEDRGYETPCWIWRLARKHDGYGKTMRNGRTLQAHIAMWLDLHGSVPDGLQLDHLCRVRECCNPSHLEPVTPAENSRRSNAAKLTAEAVAEIKASGETNKALAHRFGVDPSNVSHIRRGSTWKDINAA